jgi:spore germination protein YaaH
MYTVRPGDTLTSIARTFQTTARSIAFWNRGTHPSLDPDSPDYAPNRIEAGWVLLLIPDTEVDPEEFP